MSDDLVPGRPQIIVEESPSLELREEILRPLVEFNASKVGNFKYGPVAVYLKNLESEKAVGGLWGRYAFSWLFVELLFVPENLRGRGLGTGLMRAAEALAEKSGCTGIWLDSFSFQAPEFYRQLGYSVFGTIPDYPNTETRYFFLKTILSL